MHRGDGQADDLSGRALRLRIRQQELLAELGVLALQGTSFIEMLNHTASVIAEGLGAEYCKVMEYTQGPNPPGQNDMQTTHITAPRYSANVRAMRDCRTRAASYRRTADQMAPPPAVPRSK